MANEPGGGSGIGQMTEYYNSKWKYIGESTERLRVPGGWLVRGCEYQEPPKADGSRRTIAYDVNRVTPIPPPATFVSDPSYNWIIGKNPTVVVTVGHAGMRSTGENSYKYENTDQDKR